MNAVVFISAIAIPLLMLVGGIAAWRALKAEDEREDQLGWKDTSLDDWRRERDAEIEEAREQRLSESFESKQEEIAEAEKRQQRIGG